MHQQTKSVSSPDRRDFLKKTFNTGLVAATSTLVAGCGGGNDAVSSAEVVTPSRTKELRSYYFDLSRANPEHDFFLVAGTTHHRLSAMTPERLDRARAASPTLQRVASQSITHGGEALPMANDIQTCYVKSVPKGGIPGEWHMHTMFYHVPSAHAAAGARKMAQLCGKNVPASQRSAFQACVNDLQAKQSLAATAQVVVDNNTFCSGSDFDDYKDFYDHAMALVCHHPEIGSFDGPTLAYVQQAIVCADETLVDLAVSLFNQGPATTAPGGWATLVEYTDPATGIAKRAKNGDILYFTQHSAETLSKTGTAINSILPKVKNDRTLGANITGLAKNVLNAGLQGKMWVTRDGTPTRTAAGSLATKLARADVVANTVAQVQRSVAAGPSFTARDLSSGNGYRLDIDEATGRTVKFTVSNWYLRYLGLYVRFLDAAGNPILFSDLQQDTRNQFISSLSQQYDCFLSLVQQELVILGIPIKQSEQTFSITLPSSAASIVVLAGGLGHGTQDYPHTFKAGAVMTVVLDLALPGVFLAMAAAQGLASLSVRLSALAGVLTTAAQAMMLVITDSALAGTYKDPKVFMNLVVPIASTLFKISKDLSEVILDSLLIGEVDDLWEDGAAPFTFGIGLALQAIAALGTIAQMAETSAEVANAPWTFATQIDATHDLAVTINHDPADTQGFPETATYYTLRAVCDGGSPAESGRIAMPSTTRTQPLTYVFRSLPWGGKVTVTVAFYSDTDWLAGSGTTGPIDNTQDSASITIKENLVPLTAATVYRHKQKIGLDANDRHIWIAGQQPGVQPLPCGNGPSLCDLQSIAVNETFGAVGYVWQAYGLGVGSYATGAISQLYQFASLSFTDQPEAGWMHSGQGFSTPPRLAYSLRSPTSQNFYLDTSTGVAIVRRINMTGVDMRPSFDGPGSNRAVGRFNFNSDAFLIHPTGKLISINSRLGKIEVLVPAASPVADATAPLAQAYAGPGTRDGLLNGPVHAVVAPTGAILVLEQASNRIQAFDTGANPTKYFAGSATMPLKAQAGNIVYLDMAIEFIGYIYVLSRNTSTGIYAMDIYKPDGTLLATTLNMNVAKLAVDLFRNVFTLNFETLQSASGITQPSISEWIPSTP